MKRSRILTAALLMFAAALTSSANRLIIIDGYFFREIPIDASIINGMLMISTANGTKATGLTLKEPLPREALKYAVPCDSVPECDMLLEMYEEQKSKAYSIETKREKLIESGDDFPKFTAVDIDGKVWSSDDVNGKVMVLNCWFSGCGPCRAEMPELSKWKDEMPDVMFFHQPMRMQKQPAL